jgi:hypothetical protein
VKEDIKTRWVEALRSGEYEQGIGLLRKENRFCCLGVLCDLLAVPYETDPGGECAYGAEGVAGVLPAEAVEAAGLASKDGQYPQGEETTNLTSANDGGMPFPDIADIIEKHWRTL